MPGCSTRWMFEGCELCNETTALIRAAGFSAVHVEPFRLGTVFFPLRYQIAVTCIA